MDEAHIDPELSAQTGSVKEDVEAAVEAAKDDALAPDVNLLAEDAFKKLTVYLNGELEGSLEEYTMLEKMNKITNSQYVEMRATAASVSTGMQKLSEEYVALQPYLDQIDSIDASVTKLEGAAYKLDAYSKRLEAKFKQLQRK